MALNRILRCPKGRIVINYAKWVGKRRPSKHRAIKQRGYKALAVVGELMITAGLVLGAYVVYELYVSNFAAEKTWSDSTIQLEDKFEADYRALIEANPGADPVELVEDPKPGEAFGLLFVPKLWPANKPVPIREGIADRDLAKGLGHYSETALPGEVGNFAIAGHRATHGEPFAEFQTLAKGDEVIVETLLGRYVYSLVADVKVMPEDVWVISKRPSLPELDSLPADAKLITLTTCHPRWSSEERWIWFGVLKTFTPRAELGKSA